MKQYIVKSGSLKTEPFATYQEAKKFKNAWFGKFANINNIEIIEVEN